MSKSIYYIIRSSYKTKFKKQKIFESMLTSLTTDIQPVQKTVMTFSGNMPMSSFATAAMKDYQSAADLFLVV